MTDRKFEPVSSPDPSDVYHRVRIRCSHNGCKTSMIFSRRGTIDPVQAAKWFRDKHWGVGSNTKQDLCPEHNGRGFISDIAKRADGGAEIKLVHTDIRADPLTENLFPTLLKEEPKILQQNFKTPPEPVPPEAAVKMTKTDKRIIYAKLDEVYADEKTGYRGKWSDEKVAQDLGVPVDWVSFCRDETFGPNINRQSQIDDLMAHANEQLGEYRKAITDMLAEMRAVVIAFETRLKELKDE